MARLLLPTTDNLKRVVRFLCLGHCVAVPTETVYGLAAHAGQEEACAKVFTIKRRPPEDPLIVHVSGLEMAETLADWNDCARRLAERFWPGALTLVLPSRKTLPPVVTSGLPTVALRCPAHPVMRDLLSLAGFPLAAPSANPFGYISPTTSRHVEENLGDRIDYILEGGPCRWGMESTILDLTHPEAPRLLRPGAIPREAILPFLSANLTGMNESPQEGMAVPAPGMLPRHYSPRRPIQLVPAGGLTPPPEAAARKLAQIAFTLPEPWSDLPPCPERIVLPGHGSGEEAGKVLYDSLRIADVLPGVERIEVESPPAGPWQETLLDRLQRAAHC